MDELWRVACEDAGFVPEKDAVLLPLRGTPPGGEAQSRAIWHAPGAVVSTGSQFPLSSSELARLNSPAALNNHRVVAFTGAEPVVLLGYLRHELEHARQYDQSRAAVELSNATLKAIALKLAKLGAPGEGSGAVYNATPIEADANASAARLVLQHYGPQPSALHTGLHAALFRAPPSYEEPATLFFRAFCFGALVRDELEQIFKELGVEYRDYLVAHRPEFLTAWNILASDANLQGQITAAFRRVPTANKTMGARPGDAWQDMVLRLNQSYQRALALLNFSSRAKSG